jgi:cell division transport system permease protein
MRRWQVRWGLQERTDTFAPMAGTRTHRTHGRTGSVGTVVGIALVLFMLGLLGFMLLNARALERHFKENVRVEVYLKRDVKEVDALQFRKQLDTEPFTRSTRFITADEAAEQLKEDLGEDFLAVTGSNPLLSLVEVRVQADHAVPDSLRWIVEHLEKDPRTAEVAYNAALVENIDATIQKLTLVLGAFSLLLLIIAIALINNTIRLAIYARRFMIRTMHLVGATQWFIKRPFMARGLWQGLLAGVLAIGLIVALLQLAVHYVVPDLMAATDPVSLALLFTGVLLLGLVITLASTWFAVRRYLRMNIDELNWS